MAVMPTPANDAATANVGANTGSLYQPPAFDGGMTFKEMGQTGLRQYSGWVREEFLPQLQGRQAARVYREMSDNNATVGALLFAVVQTMRKIEWRVKPADQSPQALEEAQFADSLRFDMSHSWEDLIAESLSMLTYGFSVHEIVYKRRNGYSDNDAIPSSQFDDGRIGIRKLPIRGQDGIIKWFFGDHGEINGVTQQPFTGGMIDIPIEKMLLFRPSAHKNNPEGRSVLRNAYRSWFFLKRFEEEEAIFYERMSGMPVMYVPQELMDAAAAGDKNAIAQVNAYKKLVTNTKIGEQMGLVLPSNMWPNASGSSAGSNARMYDFSLVTPQGRATMDSDKIITRHRLDILMTALADFITLGHAAHGTQSLAENKVDMFFQAIEGWVNSIASVLNRHMLPRVWRLNGLDMKLMPEYVPDLAQRIDIAAIGDFVLKLAQAGMPLFPDEDLESYLRNSAGLPDFNDAEAVVNSDPKSISDLKGPGVAQRTPKPQPLSETQTSPGIGSPNLRVVKALQAGAERFARRQATLADAAD